MIAVGLVGLVAWFGYLLADAGICDLLDSEVLCVAC